MKSIFAMDIVAVAALFPAFAQKPTDLSEWTTISANELHASILSSVDEVEFKQEGNSYHGKLALKFPKTTIDPLPATCSPTVPAGWTMTYKSQDVLSKFVIENEQPVILDFVAPNKSGQAVILDCTRGRRPIFTATVHIIPASTQKKEPVGGKDTVVDGSKPGKTEVKIAGPASIPWWFWILFIVMDIGFAISLFSAMRLRRQLRRQPASIEWEGELRDSRGMLKLIPLEPKTIIFKLPNGYDKPDMRHCPEEIHLEEIPQSSDNKYSYRVDLSKEIKSGGAEVIQFSCRPQKSGGREISLPLFVFWEAPAQKDTKAKAIAVGARSGEVGKNNGEKPSLFNKQVTGEELKEKISSLNIQLAEQGKQIVDLSGTVGGVRNILSTLPETIKESVQHSDQEILGSISSKVTSATTASLGAIRDTIKKQMREDLDEHLRRLLSIINANKDDSKDHGRNGMGEGRVHYALERAMAAQAKDTDIIKVLQPLLENPGTGDRAGLRLLAQTLKELASAVEEIEKRFRAANMEVPDLVSQTRVRLLRLEWLARRHEDFRRTKSLPVELELEATSEGLGNLSRNVADAAGAALEYWQAPQEYLERSLDEIITTRITELVKTCDSASDTRPGLFGDALRRLLELSRLEDISPACGRAYNPAEQVLLGFEAGNRDTVLKVMSRGFRYKERTLNKPTVIVGQ